MTSRDRRNFVLNLAGETLWGLQSAMVASATVMTVLLRNAGAGERTIGSLAAIETGGAMLPQLAGAWVFSSRRNLKRDLVWWHVAGMSPVLLAMGVLTLHATALPPAAYRWILLGGFAVLMAAMGIVIATWLDWIGELFDVQIRGRAMGAAWCGSAAAGTLGASLAGWLVARGQYPTVFGWLYIAAGVIAAVSMLPFWFVTDPGEAAPAGYHRPDFRRLAASMRHSLEDGNFRSYLVGRVLAMAGFCVAPFIAVNYLSARGGALSAGTVVSCGAAMTVGMAVGNLVLGRMGDRWGHRIGILAGTGAQVAALGILLLMRGVPGCVGAYLLAGLGAPGVWTSHTNLVLETCPHDFRVAHISAANLVVGIFGVFLPLLAGQAAARWGLAALFTASAAVSALAFVWIAGFVRDPRKIRTQEGSG